MIKYLLIKNGMAAKANNCIALVSSPEVRDLNDVITHMIAEGTGLTRPQALAYFEKLTQTIEYFVGQGHLVITPLINVRSTISGVFENKKDFFDSSRHRINIRASSGLRLKELPTKIKLEKVRAASQMPIPELFVDGNSQETNLSASPGGIAVLTGSLMKFDPADSDLGVFFVSTAYPNNETRVNVYSGIKPSEIHFQVPNLPSGTYTITVKTRFRNGFSILKGEMKEIITV